MIRIFYNTRVYMIFNLSYYLISHMFVLINYSLTSYRFWTMDCVLAVF